LYQENLSKNKESTKMRYILIILFLSTLFACKKDDKTLIDTTIEGIVINTGSRKPVYNVKVIAVNGVSTYDTFLGTNDNSGSVIYAITYTDSNGKFSVTVKGNYPCIFLEKTGYRFVVFTYGSSDNYKSYIAGKTYKNEILELWADAYFNPVFKGLSCINTDSVYFDEGKCIPLAFTKTTYINYGNGPFSNYAGSKGWKGIGDKYFSYWMKYQIHRVWHERIDSVLIKSFTTYSDTIYY
jgi:hypothetical protein